MNQEQSYYSWNPNEVFQMSGLELEYFVNMLAKKISTPEAVDIITAYELKKILDKKIEEGVKSGKVEVKKETPN